MNIEKEKIIFLTIGRVGDILRIKGEREKYIVKERVYKKDLLNGFIAIGAIIIPYKDKIKENDQA